MDTRTPAQNGSPEQLLDVFKEAALSVTKLYKASVAAETRARAEGYQDCLDDLIAFLDKDGQSLGEKGASKLRKWAAERREGREPSLPRCESDEEADKPDIAPQPEHVQNDNPSDNPSPTTDQPVSQPVADNVTMLADEPRPPQFIVPSQDNFNFQSDYPYPNIELLDLSDTRGHVHHSPRQTRNRQGKPGLRPASHLGRGAGTKRRMDLDDLFGGYFGGKDASNGGGKRSRHS
ncbi:hypothetical protein ACRE_086190 [Hapsidospora chrysogenum ATCC 11550]|uniref:Uncharacterized protein n=1 Tax=Hapsidospora chrysogenum (strain ATCC 11550 / CBS 779.69 / DSM 880 / IAM 14645 / JCM 23072 / IMI 49137) TaxID=857340 RepID=A0A086SUA8_HAPC1|nr:hypothetical protein ACRE_086190 [Hapsidospora chrysogenum ATCC 11550]